MGGKRVVRRWCRRVLRAVVAAAVVVTVVPVLGGGAGADVPDPFVEEFSFTGAAQSWEVPDDVHEVEVELWGARGGGVAGGPGGYTRARLSVTPGQTLQVNVGGAGSDASTGGWNGGGDGGAGSGDASPGSVGGGATDVRRGGTVPTDRVVVAGGGGGSGASATLALGVGGAGGGVSGSAGRGGH
ncbi:MAG: hypothetical protein EKK60_10360 [Gordonia sp. (in: high G+C Gram-positive bacteria)]|nr:MAG: hypothetical protein EKK60_10360 [Gordonia sp. (in: high G+C Gram-positive bacteria)]